MHGNQPGALGRQLAARFKTRRVADLAPAEGSPIPGQLGYTDADIENRELIDGGTVIVGRTALKEYFWALKAGHLSEVDLAKAQRATAPGSSYDMVEEEELANELAEDGFFDRALAEAPSTELAEEKPAFDGGIYSSFSAPSPSLPSSPATPGPLLPSPSHLPPQPPLSIIDYSHPLGSMLWWPLKLYTYLFCERYKVEKGGRAALAIIENRTRPLSPPTDDRGIWKEEVEEGREWLNEKRKMRRGANEAWRADTSGSADLDVGLADERFFDKVRLLFSFVMWLHGRDDNDVQAFRKWPANIAQARYMYEDELKGRIIKASEAGGAEEASLRAERLEKEGRWRRNLQGWRFTRPGSGVFYDRERMDGALKVFEEAQ